MMADEDNLFVFCPSTPPCRSLDNVAEATLIREAIAFYNSL
jgi:hypothetical protein